MSFARIKMCKNEKYLNIFQARVTNVQPMDTPNIHASSHHKIKSLTYLHMLVPMNCRTSFISLSPLLVFVLSYQSYVLVMLLITIFGGIVTILYAFVPFTYIVDTDICKNCNFLAMNLCYQPF